MKLLCISSILAASALSAVAAPEVSIPVTGYFYASGKTRIEIEIDPRCFSEAPDAESPLLYEDFKNFSEKKKQALIDQAIAFIPTRLEFVFSPKKGVEYPKYEAEFTTTGNQPLKSPTDPVVVQAKWETFIPNSVETYQIKAKTGGNLKIIPINYINNKEVDPVPTLVPGEESAPLAMPEPISEEEIRSVMAKPLIFGIVLFLAFIVIRTIKRWS